MDKEVVVEFKNISKNFAGVCANKNINISLFKGEILSILGENGSGKTTLMNMLSGIYQPDEGEIFINGEKARIHSPKDAIEYGVGMVHQHFKLVDVFSAAENIILGLKDRVSLKDAYIKLNIRPFLELGFMPYKLASGDNTIFYWKGNTTPPSDYKKWCDLVQATLRHLLDRYGDEVLSWPT